MKSKRINITIDADVLADLDATAESYGMNRSECISFLFEILGELNAWNTLESVASDGNDELYHQPTKRELMKAAKRCHVERD